MAVGRLWRPRRGGLRQPATGTVRIWDATGTQVGDAFTGNGSWVRAVAVGRLGARDVMVSGGYDGTVRIWDAAGNPVGDPLTGHTGCSERGDHRAARKPRRHRLRCQRLGADLGRYRPAPVGGPAHRPPGGVRAVAVGRLDDRDVIVSGGEDGTVRIWDADRQPRETPGRPHRQGERVALDRSTDRESSSRPARRHGADLGRDDRRPGAGTHYPAHKSKDHVFAVATGQVNGISDIIVTGGEKPYSADLGRCGQPTAPRGNRQSAPHATPYSP